MAKNVKERVREWDSFVEAILDASPIDLTEPIEIQEKRRKGLLNSFYDFANYYFPAYCTAEFAKFQKKFINKVVKEDVIWASWIVSRDHGKSVIADTILPIFLMCNGEVKNMLLVSHTQDNAEELLTPLRLHLESNPRLNHDFGPFKTYYQWESNKFVTQTGCSFRAIGLGQSPRGARNEEARPDLIVFDDTDTESRCRNPKLMDQAWDWIVGALFGCFSITGKKRMLGIGNRIAKDSIISRSEQISDWTEQVNILDKTGQPSWPERFTLQECMYMIEKMGHRLSQREYFNNPLTEGKVFKKDWIQYKKMQPLKSYKHLIAYLDPGFKDTKTSDCKALVLIGLWDSEYHIIKAFDSRASITGMIDWAYEMDGYVKAKGGAYSFYMEEVFLQDMLYKDFKEAARTKKYPIPVHGDTRKKPNKDLRIEAISGHFERGNVFFNIAERENHHMIELVDQFLLFEPGTRSKKDGPDAVEGGFFLLEQRIVQAAPIHIGKRRANQNRI